MLWRVHSADATAPAHVGKLAGSIERPDTRANVRTYGVLALRWLGILVAVWAAGTVLQAVRQNADITLVKDVASARTGQLTALAHTFSTIGSAFVIASLSVVACALLYRTHHRTAALTIALGVLGAAALTYFDKLLAGRPRPPVPHLEAVSSASFPSGHATSSAALATALLLAVLATRPRPIVTVIAAIVGGLALVGVAWTLTVAGALGRGRRSVSTVTCAPAQPG